MQSFAWIFLTRFHLIMHATSVNFSNWSLKEIPIQTGGFSSSDKHLKCAEWNHCTRWVRNLLPSCCPPIPRFSVDTAADSLVAASRPLPNLLPASKAHRQGFPPAMRAKPSQPSDQGPAICDWSRFTAGANPHCQLAFSSIFTFLHVQKHNCYAANINRFGFFINSQQCFFVSKTESTLTTSHHSWVKFNFALLKGMISFCSTLEKYVMLIMC